jgi:hypothetical protein
MCILKMSIRKKFQPGTNMDFKKIDIRKYVNINSMIFSEVYIGKRILIGQIDGYS